MGAVCSQQANQNITKIADISISEFNEKTPNISNFNSPSQYFSLSTKFIVSPMKSCRYGPIYRKLNLKGKVLSQL